MLINTKNKIYQVKKNRAFLCRRLLFFRKGKPAEASCELEVQYEIN